MPLHNLSPSRLARYFYHECPRYLRFHATPARARPAAGIPDPVPAESLVTAAILERGCEWEETVVREKLAGRVQVAPGPGSLHQRSFSPRVTLTRLARLAPGEALYQPTLEPPPAFLARYGLDPDLCRFAPCRPDLLLVTAGEDGPPRLQIIDIKASDALKGSHRIQVILYRLILEEVLAAAGLPLAVDAGQAGIWLFAQDQPQGFDLGPGTAIVERFLRDDLSHILTQPLADVSWHLYFRCEWCEFYAHCRAEAERTRSISLLPYLSVAARRYLREAPWGGDPIHTLDDFERLLQDPDPGQVDAWLSGCGQLRHRRERLSNSLRALREQTVIAHGGSSLALPVNEQVKIVLTLQHEPHSGAICAAGLLRLKGQDVYGTGAHRRRFIAARPEDGDRVAAEFLSALFAELQTRHDYNRVRSWAEAALVARLAGGPAPAAAARGGRPLQQRQPLLAGGAVHRQPPPCPDPRHPDPSRPAPPVGQSALRGHRG